MSEQAKNRIRSSPFWIFLGTKGDIFDRLPEDDKLPYIRIGFVNFLIIVFYIIASFVIARGLTNDLFEKILICALLTGVVFFFHRMIVQKLINKLDILGTVIFFSYVIIFNLVFLGLLFIYAEDPYVSSEEKGKFGQALRDSIAGAEYDMKLKDFQDSINIYNSDTAKKTHVDQDLLLKSWVSNTTSKLNGFKSMTDTHTIKK